MSFPNIPDINPEINITFEDSVNLLLASIALEEISLSDLMDAEKNKILCVLKNCKHKDSLLNDSVVIDKSVNETIQNMIKLQMLLQFKLEHVKDMIPCTTTYSTSTTSTSTTTTSTCSKSTTTVTTTHTTTCTTATCSTTTKCECLCRCCLKGRGVGRVTNKCDDFYSDIAVLQALVIKRDTQNRYIRYTVQNERDTLIMKSSAYNISVECPNDCNAHSMTVSGKCHIERHSKCCDDIYGCGYFKLIVRKGKYGRFELWIEISSNYSSELKHKSGLIQVRESDSDLVMQW